MAFTDEQTTLSPRESVIMEAEKEEARLAREYSIRTKELELEVVRENNAAQIELEKLKAKWASWLRIPIIILKLPLFLLLGLAYICSMFTKKEMPRAFWQLLQ